MNCIKKINQLETEKQNEFYQIVCSLFNECENGIAKIYNLMFDRINDKIGFIDNIELDNELDDQLINEILNIFNGAVEIFKEKSIEIDKIVIDIVRESLPYASSQKELITLIKIRKPLMRKKYYTILKNVLFDLYGDSMEDLANFLGEIKKELSQAVEETNKNVLSNDEEIELTINNEKTVFKKIFDYKVMEKLAFENRYIYKWSNGSHNIYENIDTNKIVVIPSHKIGLGLSIKIQKQIYENKKIAV